MTGACWGALLPLIDAERCGDWHVPRNTVTGCLRVDGGDSWSMRFPRCRLNRERINPQRIWWFICQFNYYFFFYYYALSENASDTRSSWGGVIVRGWTWLHRSVGHHKGHRGDSILTWRYIVWSIDFVVSLFFFQTGDQNR